VPGAWTQANSFKNKTLLARMSEVAFEVPQVPQMPQNAFWRPLPQRLETRQPF
jgi:hypothetical protein